MLGGRSNTNLFSSPTQSARLPHTTISVEQSTTGGLDEERERARKRISVPSLSLSINNEWVMVRTHCHIHTYKIRIDYLQQSEQSRYGAFGEKKQMNA